MEGIYIEFLRFCIDEKAELKEEFRGIDWNYMYDFGYRQTLLGVLFEGVRRLPPDYAPPRPLLMKWIGISQAIEKQNILQNKNVAAVVRMFAADGFRSCILKGQGNAVMYPNPLSRMPGDIDVWLWGGDREIIRYVKSKGGDGGFCYHHAEFPPFNNTEIEVHYRPSFMNNPLHNRRLQQWFRDMAGLQFDNLVRLPHSGDDVGVAVPVFSFNCIFQMSHIYHHLLHEGIGLRQLLDYYFLLKSQERPDAGIDKLLRGFGMYGVSGAVMYVLKEMFALDERRMVVPPDERRGRMLLDEIFLSGNFGHHDDRQKWIYKSQVNRNIGRFVRDIRFFGQYPGECLWEPFFRLWHFFWRKNIGR
ncbi:nucleotidyltransferase family protein [Xylanibacter muris]|uniref:Nucleotidyltransferase family protein n=1 Tax=Xylanibacter muris TaxID=2736290 RepID=A0ABX2AJB5_9BACT|nr:nucleotidyltransferase family protein [Xylanibacter muris]NPD90868.1 nucleotidyltransferase family protein [Xylanibacter muris]